MREQDEFEKKNLGGYEKIFPTNDRKKNQYYEELIELSHSYQSEIMLRREKKFGDLDSNPISKITQRLGMNSSNSLPRGGGGAY